MQATRVAIGSRCNRQARGGNVDFMLVSIVTAAIILTMPSAANAQRCPLNEPKVQPSKDYDITRNGGNVTLHKKTDLEWQRCSVGQRWDGVQCDGQPRRMTWDEAQNVARSDSSNGGRWRLPSTAELMGIVESGCVNPPVNGQVFPATPADYFWTGSSYAGKVTHAWYVYFTDGSVNTNAKNFAYYVRLVRER